MKRLLILILVGITLGSSPAQAIADTRYEVRLGKLDQTHYGIRSAMRILAETSDIPSNLRANLAVTQYIETGHPDKVNCGGSIGTVPKYFIRTGWAYRASDAAWVRFILSNKYVTASGGTTEPSTDNDSCTIGWWYNEAGGSGPTAMRKFYVYQNSTKGPNMWSVVHENNSGQDTLITTLNLGAGVSDWYVQHGVGVDFDSSSSTELIDLSMDDPNGPSRDQTEAWSVYYTYPNLVGPVGAFDPEELTQDHPYYWAWDENENAQGQPKTHHTFAFGPMPYLYALGADPFPGYDYYKVYTYKNVSNYGTHLGLALLAPIANIPSTQRNHDALFAYTALRGDYVANICGSGGAAYKELRAGIGFKEDEDHWYAFYSANIDSGGNPLCSGSTNYFRTFWIEDLGTGATPARTFRIYRSSTGTNRWVVRIYNPSTGQDVIREAFENFRTGTASGVYGLVVEILIDEDYPNDLIVLSPDGTHAKGYNAYFTSVNEGGLTYLSSPEYYDLATPAAHGKAYFPFWGYPSAEDGDYSGYPRIFGPQPQY